MITSDPQLRATRLREVMALLDRDGDDRPLHLAFATAVFPELPDTVALQLDSAALAADLRDYFRFIAHTMPPPDQLYKGLPGLHERAPLTFTKDVAPIVFSACASCHRPEGVAPFPLLTYDDVKRHAAAIVAATRDRVMPPWKPEPGHGQFADERRLTETQIATLRAWLDDGAVEGAPALLPAPPKWSGEWALGEPDLVLQTPSYTLRATGGD